jgi:hypothetical protein
MTALLDLTSMNNALQRFSEALQAYNSDIKNTLYRDACIQRFEFSLEAQALLQELQKRNNLQA